MKNRPAYKEPPSTALRRHPHSTKIEIIHTVRWVAFVALYLFLTLIVVSLLTGYYPNALVSAIGVIPILVAIGMLKRNEISRPSTLLAVTFVLLITWLATLGQGQYDVGVLGYPVILIVAGLILRGRVVVYLTLVIIICLGWLTFGGYWGWYQITATPSGHLQDFSIASIIILAAGSAVYRLVKNVYFNLEQAEQEIEIRKQMEAEREALIHSLNFKNQELDRFAVRVSHDLKSPLITLAGFLGYLERDIKAGKPEMAVKDMAQINEAAKQMGKFVDELLDLSRIGRIVNPPREVFFADIVQDALKVTKGALEAKQIEVQMDANLPSVYVDRARVVQVMQNLIINAGKFMGDQPHPMIRIGFEEKNGERVFLVSDNGIGIPSEHHERIFELFNKLNPDIEGTGLGLGIVKRIIEAHNGKIWVESALGKGATFFFTLAEKNRQESV